MRIHSSPVLEDQMEALGAIPQMLDGNEVYFALHSRIVDGVESSPVNFYARKLYEVQSHVTVSNHGYLGNVVIVNKKFWDGLPSDLRKVIDDAMRDATIYGNNLAVQENDAALEAIKKNKKTTVHVLTDKENAAWRHALQPVRKQLEGRIGKAIVMAVTKEAEARRLNDR
jgi:C4-dicarboxylate-binding protein DctP